MKTVVKNWIAYVLCMVLIACLALSTLGWSAARVRVSADTADDLQVYINEVKDTDGTNYLQGTFKVFSDALTQAQAVYENADASESDVTLALKTLQAAYAGLLEIACAAPLQAEIAAAVEDSEQEKYTTSSWAAYTAALTAANATVTTAVSQEELDFALSTLTSAKNKLALRGDPAELNALIGELNNLDTTGYTLGTATAFADALETAKKVAEKATTDHDASQEELVAACDLLQQKKDALTESGDVTELQALIAKHADASKYTYASYAEYSVASNAAKVICAKTEPTAQEVAQALSALQAAAERLVPVGNKAALSVLLAETIDLTQYTASSALAYSIAKQNAAAVQIKEDTSQQDVDEAVQALTAAKNGLAARADKTALKSLLDECKELLGGNGTAESKATLKEAVEYAESVYADTEASQAEADEAVARLNEGKAQLVAVSGGCGGTTAGAATIPAVVLLAVVLMIFVRKKQRGGRA